MRVGVMVGPERGRYAAKVDRLRADGRWAEEAGLAS
ncbi:MAG: LLM class F420-dependent oxidoreductase, partial [Acidimicrobiia bacterium]|nr:LLM class F420-dependent oxidoreductase [Acidimicrobiia bacterium]